MNSSSNVVSDSEAIADDAVESSRVDKKHHENGTSAPVLKASAVSATVASLGIVTAEAPDSERARSLDLEPSVLSRTVIKASFFRSASFNGSCSYGSEYVDHSTLFMPLLQPGQNNSDTDTPSPESSSHKKIKEEASQTAFFAEGVGDRATLYGRTQPRQSTLNSAPDNTNSDAQAQKKCANFCKII